MGEFCFFDASFSLGLSTSLFSADFDLTFGLSEIEERVSVGLLEEVLSL